MSWRVLLGVLLAAAGAAALVKALLLPGVRLTAAHVLAALVGLAGAAIAILGRGGGAAGDARQQRGAVGVQAHQHVRRGVGADDFLDGRRQ